MQISSIAAVFVGIVGLLPHSLETAAPMIAQEASFFVAGYQVSTNNADELNGHGEIGKLWQRYMSQNLAAQIPDRADDRTIVVYSDYASDEKGEFSYLLGAVVKSVDRLSAGMTYRKIIPGPYAVLTTDKGPVTEVIQAEWRRIWTMPPAELGGRRAFLTDYEVYDQRSANPQQAQVEIHIGLQPASH